MLCNSNVSNARSNTSNMMSHLKNHHAIKYDEIKSAQQQQGIRGKKRSSNGSQPAVQSTIQQSFAKARKWEVCSVKHKEITDAITKYIAKDGLPAFSVEKPGFKMLIRALTDNKYELPSRTHFRQVAIPKLYNEVKATVQEKILHVDYYSATTDLWSSITLAPYISLTIHFIDSNWDLQSMVLQTQYMPQDHTGKNIADALRESLENWNLSEDKLVSLTTDSGSNVKLAATTLGVSRVPCFGHVLHNGINYALVDDEIDLALAACRKVANVFGRSWKKRRDLRKVQQELKLPEHTIQSDVRTRWASKHKMISIVIEQEQAIRSVLGDRQHSTLIPSAQHFQVTIFIQ